ncbi:unnamed protein product [Clonostachys byssicola]|uniref:Uncharacterized protein n=1 Tax=Clonostachys byssicola TaxID=160290 RepID=A0A9N9UAR3_9HYPO|nr:unnamed protein product [Clonostachys byssicola]
MSRMMQSLPLRGRSKRRHCSEPLRSQHSSQISTLTATPERALPTEVPIAHSQDAVQETEGSARSRQTGSSYEELIALRESIMKNGQEVVSHYNHIAEEKKALLEERVALNERETKLNWEEEFLTQRVKDVARREENLIAGWERLNDQPCLLRGNEERVYQAQLNLYHLIGQVDMGTAIAELEREIYEIYEREQEIREREKAVSEREEEICKREINVSERENNVRERENSVWERVEKLSERQEVARTNERVSRQSSSCIYVARATAESVLIESGDFWRK